MATASTQSAVTGSLNSEAAHQGLPGVTKNSDGSEEPLMKQAAASAESPTKVDNNLTLQGQQPSAGLKANQVPVILASGKPLKSILKNSQFKRQQTIDMPLQRRDTAGNSIQETQRYKIAFRDKVNKSQNISDVHWVESYKKYNSMDVDEETTICKCAIF